MSLARFYQLSESLAFLVGLVGLTIFFLVSDAIGLLILAAALLWRAQTHGGPKYIGALVISGLCLVFAGLALFV
jgi:hypothetical protein